MNHYFERQLEDEQRRAGQEPPRGGMGIGWGITFLIAVVVIITLVGSPS